jgi:valyl-tRNA synthetase
MWIEIDAGLRPGDPSASLRAGSRDARLSTSPPHAGIAGFHAQTLEDRWILSRFNRAAKDVNESLTTYRFDEAANRIYDFFWAEFCDWYIELIKPRLNEEVVGRVSDPPWTGQSPVPTRERRELHVRTWSICSRRRCGCCTR